MNLIFQEWNEGVFKLAIKINCHLFQLSAARELDKFPIIQYDLIAL